MFINLTRVVGTISTEPKFRPCLVNVETIKSLERESDEENTMRYDYTHIAFNNNTDGVFQESFSTVCSLISRAHIQIIY